MPQTHEWLQETWYWCQIVLLGTAGGWLLVASADFLAPQTPTEITYHTSSEIKSTLNTAPNMPPGGLLLSEILNRDSHLVPEEVAPPVSIPSVKRPLTKAPLPYYAKYVPVPKGVPPNSVRLHASQVPPIAGEVKIVNGRPTCPKKNDKPKKSKQNKRAHIDRECCLDPDEVPHPRCAY